MESSSSNSVNPTPGWSGGTRSNSASAADPMAFFDLIMKSSQAMATQGSKSLDPVASTGTAAPSSDPYTAPTDDPNLHDGYDDSSASYGSEVRAKESADTDRPADSSGEQEKVVAAAEFSEQPAAKEDEEGKPDQTALETAAAATQQEQLLGAPDTLTEGEQVEVEEQTQADVVRATGNQKEAPQSGELPADQPLDTAEESDDASNQEHDFTTQLTPESVRKKSNGSEEQTFAVAEEEAIAERVEGKPGEETSEVRSEEKGKLKLDTVEQVSEETVESEVSLETGDAAQDDSSDRKPKNTSTQRAENKKANSVDVVEPATTGSADTSTMAAVTKASEALSAAASGTAPSATSSTSSSTSNNNTGVNNLASLLQRGFQRGTLQKTEAGQTPQLDPKQQIRLINRVARAVESTPPGQSIKIRLNPSELGQLKVEIKVENGNMTAKIEAENAATRQVLLENLPQLRERLAESNINVQQFEVELMGQQTPQDGSASTFADQSDQQGSSRNSTRQGMEASREEESASDNREIVNKDAERDSRNLNVTI
ncbi:Flagellar hook-length control protein FliK [Bremerella volcania]|uniref:Flagellar hook-length control protein FliK n=1 Tax=Bremerella volcania TaxID=2527984 RepID=A0A518C5E8_9BACT|nr:flagellar hook-length control protein FliK [Bremerella volcania]QDU74424.1 Flagellar hook-length control protein FliK [Bremerella volcania]